MTDGKASIRAVRVVAPARLHLGFLDLNGALGRRFGSIGLALDEPATELTVSRQDAPSVSGPESERARRLVERYAQFLGVPGGWRVDIERAIPAHAGLGSGTQLALAIGCAMARLAGRSASVREIAEAVDRGARSSIGLAAFESGGFVIDGGRGTADRAPPVLARVEFPHSWRVLLILDARAQGVHGDSETRAFAALPPFPQASAARLCHLALMRLLPGLAEADIGQFGAAISEIQWVVGGHFATAQGGSSWTSAAVGRIAARMRDLGADGIGQSSWGPTGFAFAKTQDAAARLYTTLVEAAKAEGLEIRIVHGRNSGARIEPV